MLGAVLWGIEVSETGEKEEDIFNESKIFEKGIGGGNGTDTCAGRCTGEAVLTDI